MTAAELIEHLRSALRKIERLPSVASVGSAAEAPKAAMATNGAVPATTALPIAKKRKSSAHRARAASAKPVVKAVAKADETRRPAAKKEATRTRAQ